MVQTHLGKGVIDDVPESSTHRRGAFRPPVPPPSPPIPLVSLEQLLASQNAMMQRLVAIDERQVGQTQQHQQPQESYYFDFLATQPSLFTEMIDPLEANHWLHVTQSKFGLVQCCEFWKTLYVAQRLHGAASAWWATCTATIEDNHQVSWDEFCTAFHRHYLLVGTMHCNLWEFLHLQQWDDNVYEYIKKFNYLAQYGTHHVDTDGKKAALFRRGLSLPIQDCLVRFQDMSFNTLVSAAIAQDGTYRSILAEEEERRKRDLSERSEDSTVDAPLKYRLVYTPSIGKSRVTPPSPQWDHDPHQRQMLPQMPVQAQQQLVLYLSPVQSHQLVSPHAPQ
jgi:hypothetical protein